MTSYDGNRLSQATWGLGGRRRWRRSALLGLVEGTVLLAAWVTLWTVFVLGVVEPAARFRGATAPTTRQVEGSRT